MELAIEIGFTTTTLIKLEPAFSIMTTAIRELAPAFMKPATTIRIAATATRKLTIALRNKENKYETRTTANIGLAQVAQISVSKGLVKESKFVTS
jgi:hypothetical protein